MRLTRFAIWLVALASSSCGGSAPPPADPGEPTAVAQAHESAEPLASLCPADTDLYVEITRFQSLLEQLVAPYVTGDEAAELLRPESLGRRLAEIAGFDPAHTTAAIAHVDRVGLAVRGVGDDRSVALLVSVRDAAAMTPLLGSGALVADGSSPNGSALYRIGEDSGAGRLVAWNARRAVLAAGDTDLVADIARLDDQTPSLARTGDFITATATLDDDSWGRAYFTPKGTLAAEHWGRALTDGLFRPPQPWAASLALTPQGVTFRVRGAFAGAWVPPGEALPMADTTDLARRLPRETALYAVLSTRTGLGGARAATELQGLLALLGVRDATALFRGLGIGELGSVLGALGDQGVGALVVPDGAVLRTDFRDAAFVFAVQIRDAATAESLVALARRALEHEGYAVTGSVRELEAKAQEPGGRSVRVTFSRDLLVIAGGADRAVARAHAALFRGEDTLATTAAHQQAMKGLPAKAQLYAYSDTKRFFDALAQSGNPGVDLDVGRLARAALPAGASLIVTSEQDRLTVSFDSLNVIGPAAAMGIYGVRRYIASAKSAEAKNSVGAISRAAVAAYERELGPGPRPVHRLCGSSTAVPDAVPAGTKYLPDEDYRSGDELTGWRCLRFEVTSPQHYQYAYRQGGPYKGPARGGPDPGPRGFEVSAEGDLDGDGKTSLFTRTGTLDPSTDTVVLSPQLFISDELE